MDTSELRGWIFEFYSNTKDDDQYDVVTNNVVRSTQFVKSILDSEGRIARNKITAQQDQWFREENRLD